jgi:hypothetical protein
MMEIIPSGFSSAMSSANLISFCTLARFGDGRFRDEDGHGIAMRLQRLLEHARPFTKQQKILSPAP